MICLCWGFGCWACVGVLVWGRVFMLVMVGYIWVEFVGVGIDLWLFGFVDEGWI